MQTTDDSREGPLREEIRLLRAALARAERDAMVDALTGCLNRRGWTACLRAEERRCARHGLDAVVVIVDLDGLKAINDRFGHAVGDDVITLLGSVASSSMRTTDFIARLGGEEFAAMFSGTIDEGVLVAERVRVAFETAARTVSGRYVGATVSVGVAAHPAPTNIDAMLARADEALYRAKAAGRNRVEAELPHVDVPPAPLAPAAEAPLASDNTIAWSSHRRPRGRQAA